MCLIMVFAIERVMLEVNKNILRMCGGCRIWDMKPFHSMNLEGGGGIRITFLRRFQYYSLLTLTSSNQLIAH